MATRRSKTYFFTGVFGMAGRLFKKGNKPNQTTYQELTDSIPFINDAGDTAKTTEQGLVKVSSDIEYKAGTETASSFALVPTNKQIQDQFLLHYTKVASDALYGTTNVEHGTAIPSASKVIKTYYIQTTTGNIYLNAGGGSSWSSIFTPAIIFGTTNVEYGTGVPSGAKDVATMYLDIATGDWYNNPGAGSSTWTIRFDASTKLGTTNVESGSGVPSAVKAINTYYIDTVTGNIYNNVGGGSTWSSVFFPATIFGTTDIIHGIGVPSGAKTIKTYYINSVNGDIYLNAGAGSTTWALTIDASTVYGFTNWENGITAPTGARNVETYAIDTLTGAIYNNVGSGSSTWTSVYNPNTLFYTEAEVDAKINILDTILTDTFLTDAIGVKYTIPFPTLSATQGVEILSVITYIVNKYTDGAASTNIVTLHFQGSSPTVFCTIGNSAFTNNTHCEIATIDRSATGANFIYLGPTNGEIIAVQAGGVNHMTGSTDHVKLKISYRIHDFA
jgi:hypothetical protein